MFCSLRDIRVYHSLAFTALELYGAWRICKEPGYSDESKIGVSAIDVRTVNQRNAERL